MRVAIFTEPGQVEIQQQPVPPVSASMVVIGVQICGICGGDLACWKGKGIHSYPYSAGHEFCGS